MLCWAAIGAGLVSYYRPHAPISQREAAIAVLGEYLSVPYSAAMALDRLGVLRRALDRPLGRQRICAEIDARRVVAIVHSSPIGANHLLAISGYRADGRLWLDDPRGGSGWYEAAAICGAAGTWYRWSRTILTGPLDH